MQEKTLSELAKEERNRYYREWRQKNPEKVRAAKQRYWEKRVLAAKERSEEVC